MNVTNKTRKVNDQREWITISDAYEPIISRDVFEQVQSLLEQKAKRRQGGTRKSRIMMIFSTVHEKLQQLEIEKAELKRAIDEKKTATKSLLS